MSRKRWDGFDLAEMRGDGTPDRGGHRRTVGGLGRQDGEAGPSTWRTLYGKPGIKVLSGGSEGI